MRNPVSCECSVQPDAFVRYDPISRKPMVFAECDAVTEQRSRQYLADLASASSVCLVGCRMKRCLELLKSNNST